MFNDRIKKFVLDIYSDTSANHLETYLGICSDYLDIRAKYIDINSFDSHGTDLIMSRLLEAMETSNLLLMADALMRYLRPIDEIEQKLE